MSVVRGRSPVSSPEPRKKELGMSLGGEEQALHLHRLKWDDCQTSKGRCQAAHEIQAPGTWGHPHAGRI